MLSPMERETCQVFDDTKMKDTSAMPGCSKNYFMLEDLVQTMLERGGMDEYEEQEVDFCVIPDSIGAILDLAKKKLRIISEELMDKSRHVQYMYLEGNNLSELPQSFFQYLRSVKWLDLRSNDLTELPTPGLKDHPSLETVLLQGNRIKSLPVELATIPNLSGLQIAGNPIANVPYEAIIQGFEGIMKHLKKMSNGESLRPVSETFVVKASTSKDNSGNTATMTCYGNEPCISDFDVDLKKPVGKKKVRDHRVASPSTNIALNEDEYADFEEDSESPSGFRPKWRTRGWNQAASYRGLCSRRLRKMTTTTHYYVKQRKTRLGYKKKSITTAMIQEKAMKEIYRAQMRETLQRQAEKIQRMKDEELLKSWRRHAKNTQEQIKLLDNFQKYPCKDFANKTPFDVDQDFLNMLNRADVYRSLKELEARARKNRRGKPQPSITVMDLENQMADVMSRLQQLDMTENEEGSPRTKQNRLSARLVQISELQKKLRKLHGYNSILGGTKPNKFRTSKSRLEADTEHELQTAK